MFDKNYQGLIFPDRAENLEDSIYSDYRVFLDHWDLLSNKLRTLYEGIALRGETNSLIIFGQQGSGKTLFARRLNNDFKLAKKQTQSTNQENLWTRLTGGTKLSKELIDKATFNTEILHIEDDKEWVTKAKEWKKNNTDRYRIIIADNAERTYFIQGLLDLTDIQYLQIGKREETLELAAQRFVALCRGELKRTLFILLTNTKPFAEAFQAQVDKQHKGLTSVETLPFPTHKDKETVIRVNTNRLNPISYWYCIDKAGPEAKQQVYEAIKSEETFPGSFKAVDAALRSATSARVGRPGSKCTLTLCVLSDKDDFSDIDLSKFGDTYQNTWNSNWLSVTTFFEEWADCLISDERKASLIASEWNLRVLLLGNQFVNCLADGTKHWSYVKEVIDKLSIVHTPGTHAETKEIYWNEVKELIDNCPVKQGVKNTDFWKKNQGRSLEYESALKSIFTNYNLTIPGFLSYRPDYVVTPYKPCSILEATNNDITAINNAIKRQANVYEFTAIKELSVDKMITYLQGKLTNYIDVLEKQ